MTPTTDHTTAKLDIMDDDTLDRAFATAKAHAAELREWAQKWWDAWNTQDLDGVVALVDEDIVYEDPAMLGEHIRGRAQFRAFVEMFFRAFPDAVFVVQIHVAISAPQLPRVWTSEDHCEARLTVTSTDQYPGWWSGEWGRAEEESCLRRIPRFTEAPAPRLRLRPSRSPMLLRSTRRAR
jgi:steroid delta-isomerase-like uncharacterized protein